MQRKLNHPHQRGNHSQHQREYAQSPLARKPKRAYKRKQWKRQENKQHHRNNVVRRAEGFVEHADSHKRSAGNEEQAYTHFAQNAFAEKNPQANGEDEVQETRDDEGAIEKHLGEAKLHPQIAQCVMHPTESLH